MVDGTEQSVVVTYSIVESFCTCERWITCIHIKNLNIHITHKVFTVRYGYLSRPPIRYIHLIGYYEIEFLVMTIGKPLSRNHNFLVGISRFKAKILIPQIRQKYIPLQNLFSLHPCNMRKGMGKEKAGLVLIIQLYAGMLDYLGPHLKWRFQFPSFALLATMPIA